MTVNNVYNEFKKRVIFPIRRIRVKRLLRVYKATGVSLIRVGDGGERNDGAYVMLDDFGSGGTAISCGLGTEIWWDEEMIERGYEVWGFDHTIDKLPSYNTKLNWIPKGISCEDNESINMICLETVVKNWCSGGKDSSSDNENKRCILKIDIEGAEWDSLNAVSSETLSVFDQITLELHALQDPYRVNMNVLSKLKKTHCPIWIHANNVGRLVKGLVDIPTTLEVTYANKNRYHFEKTFYDSPIPLDKDNVGSNETIHLLGWGTKR